MQQRSHPTLLFPPKKRKIHSTNSEEPEDLSSTYHSKETKRLNDVVNNIHSQKDEQQLLSQMERVFDYINVKLPSTIIGYGQRLVNVLKEKQNELHLLDFFKKLNFNLRHEHFISGNGTKNTLNDACSKLLKDTVNLNLENTS